MPDSIVIETFLVAQLHIRSEASLVERPPVVLTYPGTYHIGSQGACDLWPPMHRPPKRCEIWWEDGGWHIRDHHSHEGVQVNGEPITAPCRLQCGDHITFGALEIRFRLAPAAQFEAG